MNVLQDRRTLAAAGAAAALVAGLAIAMLLMNRDKPATVAAPAPGQLQVEVGQEAARVDPARPLRCFVGGQFIGLATLTDCAQRNGVAAQSLDVGLDESGELAAGGELAPLQPLPQITPPQPVTITPPAAPPPAAATGGVLGECLRFGSDGWRAAGGGMTLNACVQILFDGRCQRPGEALYGRWAGQSLRLVPGRVETSPDNRSFSTLVEQGPNCAVPAI